MRTAPLRRSVVTIESNAGARESFLVCYPGWHASTNDGAHALPLAVSLPTAAPTSPRRSLLHSAGPESGAHVPLVATCGVMGWVAVCTDDAVTVFGLTGKGHLEMVAEVVRVCARVCARALSVEHRNS